MGKGRGRFLIFQVNLAIFQINIGIFQIHLVIIKFILIVIFQSNLAMFQINLGIFQNISGNALNFLKQNPAKFKNGMKISNPFAKSSI